MAAAEPADSPPSLPPRSTARDDVRGALVYLELPAAQPTVHEADCEHIRRDSAHRIGNARLCRAPGDALSLRTCGFQLFQDRVPTAPPPERAGDRRAMAQYARSVEEFVRDVLGDAANFHLRSGERVHHVAAYNHAVRCSEARNRQQASPADAFGGSRPDRKARAAHARTTGRRQSVISDVASRSCHPVLAAGACCAACLVRAGVILTGCDHMTVGCGCSTPTSPGHQAQSFCGTSCRNAGGNRLRRGLQPRMGCTRRPSCVPAAATATSSLMCGDQWTGCIRSVSGHSRCSTRAAGLWPAVTTRSS